MAEPDREDEMVSLRAFARLVPMPEATARRWRSAGRIAAERNATGYWRVPLGQLTGVRKAYIPPGRETA